MYRLYYNQKVVKESQNVKELKEEIKAKNYEIELCKIMETYYDEEEEQEEEILYVENLSQVIVLGDDIKRGVDDKHLKITLLNKENVIDEYIVEYDTSNILDLVELNQIISNIVNKTKDEYYTNNGLLSLNKVQEIVNEYK